MRRTSKRKMPKRAYKPRYRNTKKKYSIRKTIRREVARLSENKIIEGTSGTITFAQAISPASCYNLIPNITQGVTQGTRIGNRIRVRKAVLRAAITVFNQAANVTPVYVDLYIFKYKPIKVYPNNVMPTGSMNNFLQAGSTATNYSGAISDGLRPVNKDLFILKYRKRMLMFNPNQTAAFTGGTAAINPNRSFNLDITKYLHKVLQYDDNNSYCTNDDLWFALGSTQTDGSLYPGVNIGNFNLVVNVEFEDN